METNIYFCTLSLGEKYTTDYTLRLINDVLNRTKHKIAITTELPEIIEKVYPNENRIIINKIDRSKLTVRLPIGPMRGASDFNFNMRYMCLSPLLNIEKGTVIFTDCDNSLSWWDENIVQDFFAHQRSLGNEFLAPRALYKWKGFLAEYLSQPKREFGIFWHKYFNYELDKKPRPEWDEACLPAEYLLVFLTMGDKLRKFHDTWKELHDYLVAKPYTDGTWAEGFEIGVSALTANYKEYDISFNHPILSKAIIANGYKIGHPTET